MTTLTVCMGAPASGKSTWCAANAGDALVVTADAIRFGADPAAVFTRMVQLAKGALSEGNDVIVDACSTRAVDRSPWLILARKKHDQAGHLRHPDSAVPPPGCQAKPPRWRGRCLRRADEGVDAPGRPRELERDRDGVRALTIVWGGQQ